MKWAKRIVFAIVVLLLLAVAAVGVYFYVLHPKKRDAPNVTAPKTPEAIARGEYLAKHVANCVICHSPVNDTVPGDQWDDTKVFAGRKFPVSDFPGTLIGPNLTSTRLGSWTDGEILRAIREGVSKDGHALFPMMPYGRFNKLTDDDALAIIAYMRSVPAQPETLPAFAVRFPVSMFIRLAPAPLASSPPAWPADPVARGKILLEVMSCIDCHTPMERGQIVEDKLYAGGNKFSSPDLGTVYSANLTSDPATGIGAYTDDDLMRALKEGKGKDGRALWVMPWRAFAGATDEDLRAVIAALRTLKPISNTIPAPQVKASAAPK